MKCRTAQQLMRVYAGYYNMIYPGLVLIQLRKTGPYITERLLMGRKESNQTNKQ